MSSAELAAVLKRFARSLKSHMQRIQISHDFAWGGPGDRNPFSFQSIRGLITQPPKIVRDGDSVVSPLSSSPPSSPGLDTSELDTPVDIYSHTLPAAILSVQPAF